MISLYLPSQKQERRRSVHSDNGPYEGLVHPQGEGGLGRGDFQVCGMF